MMLGIAGGAVLFVVVAIVLLVVRLAHNPAVIPPAATKKPSSLLLDEKTPSVKKSKQKKSTASSAAASVSQEKVNVGTAAAPSVLKKRKPVKTEEEVVELVKVVETVTPKKEETVPAIKKEVPVPLVKKEVAITPVAPAVVQQAPEQPKQPEITAEKPVPVSAELPTPATTTTSSALPVATTTSTTAVVQAEAPTTTSVTSVPETKVTPTPVVSKKPKKEKKPAAPPKAKKPIEIVDEDEEEELEAELVEEHPWEVAGEWNTVEKGSGNTVPKYIKEALELLNMKLRARRSENDHQKNKLEEFRDSYQKKAKEVEAVAMRNKEALAEMQAHLASDAQVKVKDLDPVSSHNYITQQKELLAARQAQRIDSLRDEKKRLEATLAQLLEAKAAAEAPVPSPSSETTVPSTTEPEVVPIPTEVQPEVPNTTVTSAPTEPEISRKPPQREEPPPTKYVPTFFSSETNAALAYLAINTCESALLLGNSQNIATEKAQQAEQEAAAELERAAAAKRDLEAAQAELQQARGMLEDLKKQVASLSAVEPGVDKDLDKELAAESLSLETLKKEMVTREAELSKFISELAGTEPPVNVAPVEDEIAALEKEHKEQEQALRQKIQDMEQQIAKL